MVQFSNMTGARTRPFGRCGWPDSSGPRASECTVVESDDEEAASSVSMMLTLHGITGGNSDLPDSSIADLRDTAPDQIIDMVIALNRWTTGSSQSERSSVASGSSAPI